MTKDIDDKSRVRLSLAQFWGIIVAVATATFVVAGGLASIRAEQTALRTDLASYRERADAQFAVVNQTLSDVRSDRAESKREWGQWRSVVDQNNTRQDTEIHQLQADRHNGIR